MISIKINDLKIIINQHKRDKEYYKSYIQYCSLVYKLDIDEAYELTLTDLSRCDYALEDVDIVFSAYQELIQNIGDDNINVQTE